MNKKEIYKTIKGKQYKIIEERRQHEKYRGKSEHGKSTCIIKCPFCEYEIEAYIWSLCGCGKKCYCGAIHGSFNVSFKEISREKAE